MNKKSYPYTLKLYYPDGDPQGLCLIKKSNWTGTGVVFYRSRFQDVLKRNELDNPGVYILIQSNIDGLPNVYIGEADPIRARLINHYRNKDFWDWGIFFVAKDENLNKAHIRHLESALYKRALELKQCVLHNAQNPNPSSLSEAEEADLRYFITTMLTIFPSVGIHCFAIPEQHQQQEVFIIQQPKKGVYAKGFEGKHGFTVSSNSTISPATVPSCPSAVIRMRQQYIEQGIVDEINGVYRLTRDLTFSSPSTAASLILGNSANGRIEWKNINGITLKEIQLKIIKE